MAQWIHGCLGLLEYTLAVDGTCENELVVTVCGDDGDQRYDIYIDGVKLCREEHSRLKPGHLVDQVYKLPRKMTDGKEKVRVSIRGFDDIVVNGVKQPNTGSGWIGGFFHFAVKRATGNGERVTGNVSPERSEPRKRSLEGWERGTAESVHLCEFPTANAAARDLALEKRMAAVQTVVELGRRLRADNDLKVRQPLSAIRVAGADVKGLEDLITDELNVKKVEYVSDETELCDVSYKANFKTLGKKCGPKMKAVAAGIAALKGFAGSATVEGVELSSEDVLVTRSPKAGLVVASEGATVVALETTLSPELVAEGLAREFVSHVQAMRKEADFEVTQRINVTVETDAELKAALEKHIEYVKGETLTVEFAFGAVDAEAVDLNGHAAKIKVQTR